MRAEIADPGFLAEPGLVVRSRAECALITAWASLRLGRFASVWPDAEEGLRLYRQEGDVQGTAGCLLVMGIVRGEEGKNDEAVKLCLEAEALFLNVGDTVGQARAVNASGTSYRRLGDSARAIEAYVRSVAIAEASGDVQGIARATCNIGYVYLYERKFDQAVEYSRRGLMLERELGNLTNEISCCCNLIQALVNSGRPQEAIDFMASYDLKKLARSGLFIFLPLSHSLSTAYVKVGRAAEAGALLSLGIDRARRDGNLRMLATLLTTLAELHRTAPVEAGQSRAPGFAAARAALEEALGHINTRDEDCLQAVHEEFCALCRAEGSWDEAFEHSEEAHRIALKLSAASADERLALQRSEQRAAEQKTRADAEAHQREIERKVLQSQKTESLGVLAGGMVHHFNNLLTSIMANAELAQQNREMTADALAEIRVSGRRAAELCQQILMYTGKTVHQMAGVDVRALVDESVKLLRVARVEDCEVVCDFPAAPMFVRGDRAELLQVILNLLTNAAEARAKAVFFKAEVVRLTEPALGLEAGDYVELNITDNGEGMAPDVLARIFEPFFSTRFAGRGLGLPAAMGLVRSHKGSMTVESEPGSGTTLRLLLPLGKASGPVAPKVAAAGDISGARVVLVAEDEAIVRKVIVKYLRRIGWTALEAADGDEAVRAHRDYSGKIDLLLSDYLMPKLNGLEAALQIRSRSPEMPVILMSGFTNAATVEGFRTEGFEHFLSKPFQLHELNDVLKAASVAR